MGDALSGPGPRRTYRWVKIARVLALALLALPVRAQDASLVEALDAAVKAYRPRDGVLGIAVHSVRAGGPVYASRADEALLLASNTKLLTTAAALLRLGSDYRFRTLLAAVDQDVHVFGAGDPNISGRFHDGDPTAVFKRWAAKLKAAGFTTFRHLVLHTGAFEGPSLNPGWKDYEAWRWYVAPFAPLSLNDNCVDVTIEPGREGEPVKASLSPDTNYARVVVQAKTARRPDRPLILQRAADAAVITLKGETGARDTYSVAVPDPTLFFGTVLLETLAREGVRCTGSLQESAASAEETPGLREIDVFESLLPATLAVCNQPSQNFYAEMILRVLGWRAKGKGTLENGLAAVRETLAPLEMTSLQQADGSGLTRENRCSPADLVKLLLHMRDHPAFVESLAVNGAETGTLRRRMLAPEIRGRVRAKTGHIRGVASLSGYVEAHNGDTYVFSILANAANTGEADRLQDRVCELLIKWGRRK